MSGRLVVCPTPIGNLEDVTLRVLSALREADVVACEDTRRTRVLLDRYGVSAGSSPTTSTTSRRARAELVERMRAGATVALVSDAGMPLVSDPGYVLVRALRGGRAAGGGAAGAVGGDHRAGGVGAARGPRGASRLPPAQEGELRRVLSEPGGTLVAFESPRPACRRTLACSPSSTRSGEVAVCRELTKVHEEVVRGSAAELAERYADAPPSGEVVLVIAPAPATPATATRPALDALRGSWTRAPSRAPPPRWWRSSPAGARTRSTARSRAERANQGALTLANRDPGTPCACTRLHG